MKKTIFFILILSVCVSMTANGAIYSGWAKPELEKAEEFVLIPENLKDADLTKNITRAEFAALSVNIYEKLTEIKTISSPKETFADTKNEEILKAHNTGLMIGVFENIFEPESLLTREQAATVMARILKKIYMTEWDFEMPEKFADDEKISEWAYESVYYMAAKGIILGMGDNNFSPDSGATREQAIVIGLRLYETHKTKITQPEPTTEPITELTTEPQTEPLTKPPTEIQTTEEPTAEPTTEDPAKYIDQTLLGRWERFLEAEGDFNSGFMKFKYIDYTFDRYGQMVYRYPGAVSYTIEAKYKAYEKKIYLTEVYYYESGGEKEKVNDKTLDYSFEMSRDKEMLHIGLISKYDNYVTNNDRMAYFSRNY